MYKWCLLFALLICFKVNAQDSLVLAKADTAAALKDTSIIQGQTLRYYGNSFFPYSKKKEKLVTYSQIAAYSLNFASLYSFWYSDYPRSKFHFFDDNGEYLQVDKVSHMYGAYVGGRNSMQMWKWAGASKKKYVWLGGMTGLAYETVIEIMDGFSEHWGFSTGDYAANILGASLLVGQELLWDEQRIQLKYSTHLATYEPPVVDEYLNRIYGKSKLDRLFKDYNAQTYWLSFNVKSFFKKSNLPDWFSVAVGYGGQDMYGANWDGILDNTGNLAFPEDHFKRYRQWYLAPDIDLTKIKTKSKLLKTVFFVLNSFKFPAPSLELSRGNLKWNWIHF